MTDFFADIEDNNDWATATHIADFGVPQPATFREICPKCRGTGRFTRSISGGQCYACKGVGSFERKTSPEARHRARVNATARKIATAKTAQATFAEQHPAEAAWIASASARSFGFAVAMRDAIAKYGHLTERQFATVERCAREDAERAVKREAEKVERVSENRAVSVERIEQAFATAKSNGIKRPKLRLANFKFSPAPDTGNNAGSIYVKRTSDEEYLGKITAGKFLRARVCEAVEADEVVSVASNPDAAATAYGQRTGKCSCCGKELTVKESIDRAIGPVCATKYGW